MINEKRLRAIDHIKMDEASGSQPSSSTLPPVNGIQANGTGATKKQVQLVGAPPPFYGLSKKDEISKDDQSDDDFELVEEDDLKDDGTVDKDRLVADGEVKDEDLLADFDEDEDVG